MILDIGDLPSIKDREKGKIVYARGAFDILHAGHIDFLEYAKQQGDVLIVGIISDQVIRQNKGADRPIKDERDRLEVMNAIRYADYTFIVPAPTNSKTHLRRLSLSFLNHMFLYYSMRKLNTLLILKNY